MMHNSHHLKLQKAITMQQPLKHWKFRFSDDQHSRGIQVIVHCLLESSSQQLTVHWEPGDDEMKMCPRDLPELTKHSLHP